MRGLMIGAVSTLHPESPGPQLGAPAGGPGPVPGWYGGTVTEIVGVVPPRRDSPPVDRQNSHISMLMKNMLSMIIINKMEELVLMEGVITVVRYRI